MWKENNKEKESNQVKKELMKKQKKLLKGNLFKYKKKKLY